VPTLFSIFHRRDKVDVPVAEAQLSLSSHA
jgi:hypothetical protein